jgi:glycosyltransferase involved in cell wall biosynthesis
MKILVIGEEHVRAKAARHYELLALREGVKAHFFVDDRSGITRGGGGLPVDVTLTVNPRKGPAALLRYWREFRRLFDRLRPDLLEVYPSIHPLVLLPMMAYAMLRGTPRTLVLRGELIPVRFARLGRNRRAALLQLIRMADLIIYKDFLILETLRRHFPRKPAFGWSNAIPVRGEPDYARPGDRVLFLNSFHPLRNLPVVVRAARRVREAVPTAEFHLVGGAGELAGSSPFFADLARHEAEVRAVIREEGVGDFVHIHPFTPQVQPHFAAAKVYVFPSDHVFANYSLLEAMERGVPPVVSDERDPHARRIVTDGVNGRVVPIDPDALADAVIALLRDEPARRAMGSEARRTVKERFNLEHTVAELAAAYGAVASRRAAAFHPECTAPCAGS